MTRRRLFAQLVAMAIATSGSACSATSPSSTFGILSIQGPEALRIGESTQFRVLRTRQDGSQEEVLGQWSATGPYMTVQTTNGLTVAGAPGIAELRASVDGIAAVRAIRVVPDLRGTWTGRMYVSCTSSNVTRPTGAGPSMCGYTPTLDFLTRVQIDTQSGDAAVGNFTILDSSRGTITGSVGVDGSWNWNEFTATAMTEYGPYQWTFKSWRMTPHAQLSQVAGSGSFERKYTNAWGYQHYIFKLATMMLQREVSSALAPAAASGGQ